MWKEPPEKVSQEKITFDVREPEPILSGPDPSCHPLSLPTLSSKTAVSW